MPLLFFGLLRGCLLPQHLLETPAQWVRRVHKGPRHLKRLALLIQDRQYTFTASALCDAIKIILNRGEHRGSHS